MENVHRINLSPYFNAKAIGELSLVESELFQNVGISDTMIAPNSFVIANKKYETYFDAPKYRNGTYDHIVCQGQRIDNISCHGDRIYLLGFCEWINSNEILTVEHGDGTSENCRFTMEQSNYYQKKEKWSGKKMKIMHRHLYTEIGTCDEAFWFDRYDGINSISRQAMCVSVCELTKNKQISSIVLPDNELMHIFAVTVANM